MSTVKQETVPKASMCEPNGFPAAVSVTVDIVDLKEPLPCFKVTGDDQTVDEFAVACNAAADAPVRSDWSGLYVQFGRAHAVGTIGYRWDQGYRVATMVALTLRVPRVAVVREAVMSHGGIGGAAKAAAVRAALGLRGSGLLMDDVGREGLALACWETEGELELCIADALVEQAVEGSRVVEQFRPNRFGVTAERRALLHGASIDAARVWGSWEPFDEFSASNEAKPQFPTWAR